MPKRTFPVLDGLIRQAEQAAASKPDPVQLVAEVTRLIGDMGADPYLLIGVLVEGAIHTLVTHIPPERRTDCAKALTKLLADRLDENRLSKY
jgi:hypothetical protein